VLNDHCQICEFRDCCRGKALANDDLSLLRSLTAPEIQKYKNRGVFAVNQLAYAFRPRRQRLGITRHDPTLKALAVRDRKVYFYGEASLPADCGTRVYLDVEGDLRTQRAYLIGMLVSKDGVDHWHSLWADRSSEEPAILGKMLQVLAEYQNPTIYHYGQFDVACLKRMAAITKTDHLIRHLIERAVNVLVIVHKHLYFPTYSNGLKDIGSYLGCSWTDVDAAGVQAVVWRTKWQQTGDQAFRNRLVQYNHEDCLALKCVTEFIYRNATADSVDIPPADALHKEVDVARADGFVPVAAKSIWNQRSTSFPDFESLNRCAYLDYQRQHVIVRTNKTLKRIRRMKTRRRPASLRPNKCVAFIVRQCPYCSGKKLKAST
jgi:predicted RecB family nuclease